MNTKKRMLTAFAVSAALLAGGAFAADPTIREGSVTFAQDAASKRVTIGYELEGAPAIVTVDILTNGVSIGAEHLTHMAGDVNRRVEAGAALMAVAGALSVGTVAADVDARYCVEMASLDVYLCQQGLVLTIR